MKLYRSIKYSLNPINLIDKLILVLICLFLFNCVFDPAGLFFKVKTILFISAFVALLFKFFLIKRLFIPNNVLKFIILFSIIIPTLSIVTLIIFHQYHINSLKSIYGSLNTGLFLLILFIFYNTRYNYLRIIIFWLTTLSIIIIVIHFLLAYSPHSYSSLQRFGTTYKIFKIASGPFLGMTVIRVYFWTSPMLVLAIAFFSYKIIHKKFKWYYLVLLLVNILGMLYSGSRVNITISLITFFIILLFYLSTKNLIPYIATLIFLALIVVILKTDEITMMFGNNSDTVKFGMINDYIKILTSNVHTFLFGQGLGSEAYFEARNMTMTYTELTYFEVFRKYGIILGCVLIFTILYPILQIRNTNKDNLWLLITYSVYLFMSFFNPFLFSSSGMIILSFTLFYIFQNKDLVLKIDQLF